jgi:hypothetical protein
MGETSIDEKMLTAHPQGKAGVNISKHKYEQIRWAIIDSLGKHGEMTFSQLGDSEHDEIGSEFEGSVSWYYTSVKLDLEARGEIERVGSGSPQKIRLAS